MKNIEQWLDEYGVSHQNPTNKTIHWICVPLIVFSLIGLLWIIPTAPLRALPFLPESPYVNWATLFLFAALGYYLFLSRTIFIGMIPVAAAALWGNYQLAAHGPLPLWQLSIIIFTAAWIGQFIGHKIEGKKPSFFKDVQFLLIGPAWLMSFVLKRLGVPL